MTDKCPGCGAKGERTATSGLCNLDIASPRAKFDCGTVLYGKGVWFHSVTCHQNQIETLKGEVRRLQTESAEMQGTFDIIQAADMRAIEMWHESHPGTELMQPDHAKMVIYLLGKLDKYKAVAKEAAAGGCSNCGLSMWDDPDPDEGQPCECCEKLYKALTDLEAEEND